MTLPVVLARTLGPQAGRAIAKRVSAWAATANISKLNTFKDFLARHPQLASIAGSIGITSVVEAAMNGDPGSIQALNDAATEVGINIRESFVENNPTTEVEDKSLFQKAYEAVVGDSSEPAELSDDDASRAQELRNFARFIRSEISGSPEFVLRHHALMRKYLAMDAESLDNLLKAY